MGSEIGKVEEPKQLAWICWADLCAHYRDWVLTRHGENERKQKRPRVTRATGAGKEYMFWRIVQERTGEDRVTTRDGI